MQQILLLFAVMGTLLLGGCVKKQPESSGAGNFSFASPEPSGSGIAGAPVESLPDAIKSQLATKYSKPVADVNLTVSQEMTAYAKGMVSFAGEMGGAIWLAAKTKGGWILVHDGQGPMTCATADEYGFPNTLVPECMSNQQLIKR